jgi:glycolate oxidase iron-sulfur subunit
VRTRHDRWLRSLLARLLPDNIAFRRALWGARLAKPFAPLLAAFGLASLAAMLRLAPWRLPRQAPPARRRVVAAQGERKGRVALLSGCVSPVLAPSINEAAIAVLTRHGIEVVVADGCCGSLAHHMGREREALAAARARIDAWTREIASGGLDAIVVTASGCGTTVKDYGFMLRGDSAYAAKAAAVSALARDIGEYLCGLKLSPAAESGGLVVAYHSACSLEHGQKIGREPRELLGAMGFVVKEIPEAHLCCGSAGIYNILQPAIAKRLRERKVGNIEELAPNVIAAGNIGCITQIAAATAIPVVHTVELINWMTGGRKPEALRDGS